MPVATDNTIYLYLSLSIYIYIYIYVLLLLHSEALVKDIASLHSLLLSLRRRFCRRCCSLLFQLILVDSVLHSAPAYDEK